MKGFIKNLGKFVCLAAVLGGLTMTMFGLHNADKVKEDMLSLAKENGYEDKVKMDEFMHTSTNVSQSELSKYNELQEQEGNEESLAFVGLGVMSIGAVGGLIVKMMTDNEEDELSLI